MKLQSVIQELEGQRPQKWDQRINSAQLEMVSSNGQARFQMPDRDQTLAITKPCHAQIAERLDIPIKYYFRMEKEAPALLANNANTWLKAGPREFFVRGLGDSIRALLSDKYRVIDHLDVLYCAMNELQAYEAEVEDCYLSETELNIKVKSGHLKDFIRHKDDLIVGGLLLTNSETGHRALRIEPRTFRVLCSNGMVIEDLVSRQIHLGNGNNGSDEDVYLSIRRSIRELFARFGEIVVALRESTEIKVGNPAKVINNLVEHYRLSEEQKANILMAFGAEPEADKYGIANAVTRAAQREEGWENSLELERIGGKLITLPAEEFKDWDQKGNSS